MTAYTQTKQGYIDLDKVIQSMTEYTTLEKQLEIKTKQFEDSLLFLYKEYQSILTGISCGIELDSIEKISWENSLIKIENEIMELGEDYKSEIAQEEKEISEKMELVVAEEIELYRKNNKIYFIVERESILYCLNCKDYTEGFINYLNKRINDSR